MGGGRTPLPPPKSALGVTRNSLRRSGFGGCGSIVDTPHQPSFHYNLLKITKKIVLMGGGARNILQLKETLEGWQGAPQDIVYCIIPNLPQIC